VVKHAVIFDIANAAVATDMHLQPNKQTLRTVWDLLKFKLVCVHAVAIDLLYFMEESYSILLLKNEEPSENFHALYI